MGFLNPVSAQTYTSLYSTSYEGTDTLTRLTVPIVTDPLATLSVTTGDFLQGQSPARVDAVAAPAPIPAGFGSKAATYIIKTTDGQVNSGHRAELRYGGNQAVNNTYWYVQSIFVPSGVQLFNKVPGQSADSVGHESAAIYAQMHHADVPSASGMSPCFAFTIQQKLNTDGSVSAPFWKIVMREYSDITTDSSPANNPLGTISGYPAPAYKGDFSRWLQSRTRPLDTEAAISVKLGEWTDFIIQVRWTSSESTGFMRAWVVDSANPNGRMFEETNFKTYPSDVVDGPYLKWGIYKYQWKNSSGFIPFHIMACRTEQQVWIDMVAAYKDTGNTTTPSVYQGVFNSIRPARTFGAVPAAPSGLSASGTTSTFTNLTWTDNASNETGFKLERKLGSGSYGLIASPGANATSYSDSGLAPGSSYTYRVTATNGTGNSAASNEVVVNTPFAIPSAPTGLTATAGNASVSLDWADTAGATSYTIKYGTSPISYPSTVTGLTSSSGSVSSLTNGTAYYFVVTATNAAGTSGNSAEVTATPSGGGGGSVVLYPEEDSYAFGGSPGSTNATANPLLAKDDGTTSVAFDRVAYLKFNLSGLTAAPTGASLVLTSDGTTEAGTATVSQVGDGWTEAGLTWTNHPTPGTGIGSAAVAANTVVDYTYAVTSYVQSEYANDPVKFVSFAITGNNALLKFASREAAIGAKPELIITTGGGTPPRLTDDFTASNSNWTNVSGGIWTVTGGKLQLTVPATPTGSQPNGNIRVHNTGFSGNFNYTVDASVTANAGSAFDDFSVIFGYVSATNYYYASFNESNDAATNGLFYYNGTTSTQVVDFTALITSATTYTVKIEYIGTTLKVYRGPAGGSLTLYATYTVTLPASGKIGVGSKNDSATFDNALVP